MAKRNASKAGSEDIKRPFRPFMIVHLCDKGFKLPYGFRPGFGERKSASSFAPASRV